MSGQPVEGSSTQFTDPGGRKSQDWVMPGHIQATSAPIRVAPAASGADWLAARQLTGELIDWMADAIGFDPIAAKEGSADELDDMAGFYSLPHGMFLLGRVGTEVAGTSGIHLLDETTAELKRVWVSPWARGHGLAKLLLDRAVDAARVLGVRRMVLETDPEVMRTAAQMYASSGFRPTPHYSTLHLRAPRVLSMEKLVA